MAKRAEKQVVHNKAELLKQLQNNSAFMSKMKFVKEKFWPALLDASTSIEDSQQLLSGFNTQIMQTFLGEMKNKSTKELNLIDQLDKKAENYEAHKKLVELFDDLNIFDAKDYIEGMKNEIELWKSEEMQLRPLSSLKAKFIDEM